MAAEGSRRIEKSWRWITRACGRSCVTIDDDRAALGQELEGSAMLENLVRLGHLETVVAERVALMGWRLRRVPAYETASAQDDDFGAPAEPGPHQLLPAPDEADRIVRYEAHLARQFYQALHELEAQQARRRGQAAPLARVEVHGLAEA